MHAGFMLTVLTIDGPVDIELPCTLDDDMTIVIENKGVPYAEGRGIHHVRQSFCMLMSSAMPCAECSSKA